MKINNLQLEIDMKILSEIAKIDRFDAAWTNAHGRQITVDYAKYADESKVKYWLYRFMEWSGLSTF